MNVSRSSSKRYFYVTKSIDYIPPCAYCHLFRKKCAGLSGKALDSASTAVSPANTFAELADKVFRQALAEADRTGIEERLNATREKFRYAADRLVEILQSDPEDKHAIEAAKNLAMLDIALLRAEIDCGMYKKPIDAIAREFRYDPLPAEMRMVVIAAWKRGGLLPKNVIHEMVLEQLPAPASE
jgi:hypothetical protein